MDLRQSARNTALMLTIRGRISIFESIGECVKKYFDENSEEMLKNLQNLVLENLPQILDAAGKVAKEIGKNAKIFLK